MIDLFKRASALSKMYWMHLKKYPTASLTHRSLFHSRLALLVLLMCFSIFMLVVYMDRRLPVPLTVQDAVNHPSSFIEERARNHLKKLTRVGARPAGAHHNYAKALAVLAIWQSSLVTS